MEKKEKKERQRKKYKEVKRVVGRKVVGSTWGSLSLAILKGIGPLVPGGWDSHPQLKGSLAGYMVPFPPIDSC